MEYYTSDVSGKRAARLDRACGQGASMRSPLAIGTAVALLLAPAVGCRKPEPKDIGKVRVAYLQIIPSLPVFIAQEQQLFDKANLRLQTVVLSSSNDVVNAMVAGQADILPAVSLVPILHLEIQSPGRVRLFGHADVRITQEVYAPLCGRFMAKQAAKLGRHIGRALEILRYDARFRVELTGIEPVTS